MNGALTVYALDELKRKARNCDAALEYLNGTEDSEQAIAVEAILRRGEHTQDGR